MEKRMVKRNDIGKKDRLIFLVVLFLPLLLVWRDLTNDIWFLLSSGRYVVQHGFPYVEPLTLHQGFEFMMQQWLSAVIFWGVYRALGVIGLKLLVLVFYVLLVFVLYKLCMKLSENYFLVSVIVVFGASFIFVMWLSCRPLLFSTLILLLEIYCLESYILSRNKKYLFFIPILSVFLINLHASLWPLMFIFLVPYIIDSFSFKIGCIAGQGYEKKALLIITGISLIAGFANPYGWSAMTYLFRSSGHMEINNIVAEMRPLAINHTLGFISFLTLFLVFLVYFLYRKGKTKVRYVLLMLGTTYMTFSAQRCILYFVICASFSLAWYLRDIKLEIPQREETRRERILKKMLVVFATAAVIFGFTYESEISRERSANLAAFDETIEVILAEEPPQSIVLYTGYDDGSYAEFRGLAPYLDPRAEVFVIENNKKDDVFEEYYNLETGRLYYKDFLDKYQFTHLILTNYDVLYANLVHDPSYNLVCVKGKYTLFERISGES